jgi:hypothetical protein
MWFIFVDNFGVIFSIVSCYSSIFNDYSLGTSDFVYQAFKDCMMNVMNDYNYTRTRHCKHS